MLNHMVQYEEIEAGMQGVFHRRRPCPSNPPYRQKSMTKSATLLPDRAARFPAVRWKNARKDAAVMRLLYARSEVTSLG
jgi:hypothetical protein